MSIDASKIKGPMSSEQNRHLIGNESKQSTAPNVKRASLSPTPGEKLAKISLEYFILKQKHEELKKYTNLLRKERDHFRTHISRLLRNTDEPAEPAEARTENRGRTKPEINRKTNSKNNQIRKTFSRCIEQALSLCNTQIAKVKKSINLIPFRSYKMVLIKTWLKAKKVAIKTRTSRQETSMLKRIDRNRQLTKKTQEDRKKLVEKYNLKPKQANPTDFFL